MKIVCISDIHGKYRSNNIKIPKGDVLIYAGDYTAVHSNYEFDDFLQWLTSYGFNTILLIAGNHDACLENELQCCKSILSNYPTITYLENSSITIDGIKFYGTPVQPMYNNWAFNYNNMDRLIYYNQIPDDTDVLITHCPPKFILDQNNKGEHCGDFVLLNKIERLTIKYHIFGHIHNSGSNKLKIKKTTYINCSLLDDNYQLVYKPMIFNISKKRLTKKKDSDIV